MCETLTQHMRRALDAAGDVARELDQDSVGVEHLVVGLLGAASAEADQCLRGGGIEPAMLREQILLSLPKGTARASASDERPLSPKATAALDGAIVLAQRFHESRISTRIMLLAILDKPENDLLALLDNAGVRMDGLRDSLERGAVKAES